MNRRPFIGLSLREWRNLGLPALAVVYVIYVSWGLQYDTVFSFIGMDYRSLRASAEISQTAGFAAIYDLSAQALFQDRLLAVLYPENRETYLPMAMPYLPVFVVPFMALLLLPPLPSFLLWTALNVLALEVYLWRYLKAIDLRDRGLYLLVPLSFPVFTNLLLGQVNVLLAICLGEFLLAQLQGARIRSGLFLGGLLIKPQTLLLLVPGLAIARQGKTLAGFCLTSLGILAASFLLAGLGGLTALISLLVRYPTELPYTAPEAMMNWRAVAINMAAVGVPERVWMVAVAAMVVTGATGLFLWRAKLAGDTLVAAIGGTYAATCAVAWHSHVQMVIPLIFPLLYLRAKDVLPAALFRVWFIAPPAIYIFIAFTRSLPLAAELVGLTTLALNIAVVVWSARTVCRSCA